MNQAQTETEAAAHAFDATSAFDYRHSGYRRTRRDNPMAPHGNVPTMERPAQPQINAVVPLPTCRRRPSSFPITRAKTTRSRNDRQGAAGRADDVPEHPCRSRIHQRDRPIAAFNASDLHLVVGDYPMLRVDGKLVATPNTSVWDKERTLAAVQVMTTDQELQRFEQELELDVSFAIGDLVRFRVNVYQDRNGVCAAVRTIPLEIKR